MKENDKRQKKKQNLSQLIQQKQGYKQKIKIVKWQKNHEDNCEEFK